MSQNLTTTTENKTIVQSPFSANAMTHEQMEIIKNQIAPGISTNDLMYCLEIAKQAQLNPIIKDIYFVPRKANIGTYQQPNWVEKYEPMVGRKGARAIARRKGMIVPPTTGHTLKLFPYLENGEWKEKRDLIGWAELEIAGQKVRKEAAYSIYKQTNKEGKVTQFWEKMPTTMVEKVAEFQLLDAIYGLDGVMSIDAGVLGEDDLSSNLSLPASKVLTADIEASVVQLGLNVSKENGVASITGTTFGKDTTLKGLGFSYNNGKWQMNCPEEIIEGQTEAPKDETPPPPAPPKQPSPAGLLMKFLADNGLDVDEQKVFVNQHLQVTKKDTKKIESFLANKDVLLGEIMAWRNPVPLIEAETNLFDQGNQN